MTIQELAEQVRELFVQDTRPDGDKFWKTEGAPEWVRDLCHHAHGDMLPDDWRYEFIVEALNAIAEADDPDDIELEGDPYHHQLLDWLGSHATRFGYVDDWIKSCGHSDSVMIDIEGGQVEEKREVLGLVLEFLRERVEEEDEEEEVGA